MPSTNVRLEMQIMFIWIFARYHRHDLDLTSAAMQCQAGVWSSANGDQFVLKFRR